MKWKEITVRRSIYLGSTEDYDSASLVLFGIPMDLTTSFRPGTRLGPVRVREVSEGIEEYSPYLDRNLSEVSFFDVGDVPVSHGNAAVTLARAEKLTRAILEDGKKPVMVGGEHLVSWPVISSVADKYPGLAVLHFDAHADLREEYLGEELSHATVMGKVAAKIGPQNLYQFGIRSGSREEFLFGRANTNFYPYEVLPAVKQVVPELVGRPVYVSIDIDVLDPAFAPGTGTPEAGGCSARELLASLHTLQDLDIVGLDVVEISPPQDIGDVTALFGAKLIREALLLMG